MRLILKIAYFANLLLCFGVFCGQVLSAAAVNSPAEEGPSIIAARIDGNAPKLDGILDDRAWRNAAVATNFVQMRPVEGAMPTETTKVYVLFGEGALYVGFRAYDSDPNGVIAQLTRRDEYSQSDWVYVSIDSLNDGRTAFQFAVNPVGVKRDLYRYDDTEEDSDWDAVWDVAARTDDQGWSAEFRIPYSQLRFNVNEGIWGIQFARFIARKNESSYWSPTWSNENAIVSQFGELRGVDGVRPERRFEFTPYTLARADMAPNDQANPFYRSFDTHYASGVDIKYGLSSDLTLDLTINPDFGQVEADPSEVNLSDSETFYSERRPFFLEGSNIFRYDLGYGGTWERDALFYTRRIGRAPQRYADASGGYIDHPENVTIQSAAKISGKTNGGWTIGFLHAATDEERARTVTTSGDEQTQIIEPATQYGFARIQKDYRSGRSALGVVGTAVLRDADSADLLLLHRDAYAGGMDFRHYFGADEFEVKGRITASRVSGSSDTIRETQRAPGRYMHRPDARHRLGYDPDRTSLSGTEVEFNLGKVRGGKWTYGVGYEARSVGFEVNDMGFMHNTDGAETSVYAGFNQFQPTDAFLRWNADGAVWRLIDGGGQVRGLGGNINANFELHNYWNIWTGVGFDSGSYNSMMLRGGPSIRYEDQMNFWGGFKTDNRNPLVFSTNVNVNRAKESESHSFNINPSLTWRPNGRLQLELGSFYSRRRNDRQWVTRFMEDEGHYIFGRMNQATFGLTGRLDYAFTSELTLQVYLQPFISAGRYDEFKQVADPSARSYSQRFRGLEVTTLSDGYLTSLGGTEQFIYNPDFNFQQYRSNMVLRWEYRPGSSIFAVWSQGREDFSNIGNLNIGSDLNSLFGSQADDVVMVKVRHLFNPFGG